MFQLNVLVRVVVCIFLHCYYNGIKPYLPFSFKIPYLFPNDNEIMGTLKESPAAEPSLPPLCGPLHPYPAESNSPTIDCFKQDISKGTALLYQ